MAKRLQAQDLTTGPLGRQIMAFSIPLLLSNILQVLFNMSDIAVVGRFSGAHALGSVGSTAMLVSLFTGFMMGIGGGVNALTAQFFGAKRETDLRQTVHTSFIVTALIGIVFLAVGVGLAYPMLQLIHTKPELIDDAALYLRIYYLAMPAVALYNFGSGVLCAVGDTKRPLYILLGAGLLNVCLNLFFVIVCQLSVAGVALASLISHCVAAALILLLLFRGRESHNLKLCYLRLDRPKAWMLLKLGVPSGLHYSSFAVANLFLQVGINSFDAVTVEGNSAAANSDSLIYDTMAAFCTACASFIGQNFGAGRKDRVRASYLICLGYTACMVAALGCCFVLFGRQFLSLFTTDAAVIEAGMTRMTVMAWSYIFTVPMDVTVAACRGLGKSAWPTVFVFLGCCVLRIVWVYTVFAWIGTIFSLYLAYVASWILTVILVVPYFIWCYKKTEFCPG